MNAKRVGGVGGVRATIVPLVALVALVAAAADIAAVPDGVAGADLVGVFAREVDRRLDVPAGEQEAYLRRLEGGLEAAGVAQLPAQYVFLVDRSAMVQAGFLFWRSPSASWEFIGAMPVSTGRPGSFEHFLTPIGVFEHTLANPDFRSEGTLNKNGIRGYGRRGMRVFDFGWVTGERGWGRGGTSPMRLQLHATDPDLLEPRLGRRESKGCIRVPASLNEFLDRRGVLDAEYLRAAERGERLWVLRPDREPTRWPGKYLVIIESERTARPDWARPGPARLARAGAQEGC